MGGEEVAIASERSFMLTAANGDIEPGTRQGLFLGDTRFLSCQHVSLSGVALVPLGGGQYRPNRACFYATNPELPGVAAGTLVLERRRKLNGLLTEWLRLSNHGRENVHVCLRIEVGADFADVFELRSLPEWKLGPTAVPPPSGCQHAFAYGDERFPCRTLIKWSRRGRRTPGASEFDIELAPGERWSCSMQVELVRTDAALGSQVATPPGKATPEGSEFAGPSESSGHSSGEQVRMALPILRERADSDLKTLQFQLTTGERIIGAGLPYFMTLFGRDSIITAHMVLNEQPSLAADVLTALAQHQGHSDDPVTEEQAGKIAHEVRDGELAQRGDGRRRRYYGSVDATPLFLILLSEYVSITGDMQLCDRLWPAAEAALDWIDRFGDVDGDGFVEYIRRNADGLENQGWKDSWDSVCFENGALAEPPIALCEVQAYVYDAKMRMAALYDLRGKARHAGRLRAQAATFREAFERAFWMEAAGTYAMALDSRKRQVDSVASNAAHCLWSGIASPEHAIRVAGRLLRPDCFSGWGLRTLSSSMASYNPIGYHTGSVWPHDTVMAAEGFLRYGLFDPARRLLQATISSALRLPYHRLPELFAGYSRRHFPEPIAYPDASAPQAWAAAATLRACALLDGRQFMLGRQAEEGMDTLRTESVRQMPRAQVPPQRAHGPAQRVFPGRHATERHGFKSRLALRR
jgi:glycogen debranching enzyme